MLPGVMISNVMGYGNQNGYKQMYRGNGIYSQSPAQIKSRNGCAEDAADSIVERIVAEITTGTHGDGKIFIYDVQDAVRIRTGERGEEAL